VFFYWASKKVSIGLDFKIWSVRGYGVFRGTSGRKGRPADNRQKRPQQTGKRPTTDNMIKKAPIRQQAKGPHQTT